jgi:tRNA U34 5-methylaminomethyl-2-thiouridine-forming methyltransferase MnmC
MVGDAYIRGKGKDQLLTELLGTAQVASPAQIQQLAAIFVRSVEDLEAVAADLRASVDRAAEASARLQRVLAWLTLALFLATAVGAFAAAWQAFAA